MNEKLNLWRKRKKELKLTNKELALKANLPLRTVEQVMCGRVSSPRLDTVQAIERALEIISDSSAIKITPEDRTLGVRDTIKISVTPEEEEILYLYREIVKKKGERAHEVLLALFEGLSKID